MLARIHSQHFHLTPAIRRFATENLSEPVEQLWKKDGAFLDIELRDIRGGNKHGIDRECRCMIQLPNAAPIVITEVTEDMRTSIHQVRKRLVRRLRQYVQRRVRRATRAPPRRPLAKVQSARSARS